MVSTGSAARVAIIGGGISGLSAAWRLANSSSQLQISVYEASDRFGGKLQTTPFAGKSVDTGADAFLARVPEGVALCRELGIDSTLVSPARRNAWIWSRGALRRFPSTILGIPSDLDELEASGIISDDGMDNARQEPRMPAEAGREDIDVSVEELVGTRFGVEVAQRLVDPLVGGINAGRITNLSAASATPQLYELSKRNSSLLIAAREQLEQTANKNDQPIFYAPAKGMQQIVNALVEQLPPKGVQLLTQTAVFELTHAKNEWHVDGQPFDAVIVATPAYSASKLLSVVAPNASDVLATIPYASVAIVRLAYNRSAIRTSLDGSGFVIPAIERKLLTACSWASSKWDELKSDDTVIFRASAGRYEDPRLARISDSDLVSQAHHELSEMLEISDSPRVADVIRWDYSFPQYTVGHESRLQVVETEITTLPGIAVAGAAYRGLGVPSCIRSGNAAAASILQTIEAAI